MRRVSIWSTAALGLALAATLALPFSVWGDGRLPLKGRADEVVTNSEPQGDGFVLLTLEAKGQMTYLGRFTGTEKVLLNTTDGTFSGSRFFTAANGDQLFAETNGAFTSPTTAAGTFTFTGGTGRFKNASGKADFDVVSPDGIHVALTFAGTIEF
jgi:hypothetical protein